MVVDLRKLKCSHEDGQDEKSMMVLTTFTTKATAVGYHIDDKMPQCHHTKSETREFKELCDTETMT
jgi:hypothetical protein